MNLRDYFHHYRVRKVEFCEKIGISPQYLSLIINNHCQPSLKVCKAINKETAHIVSLEELINIMEDKKKLDKKY